MTGLRILEPDRRTALEGMGATRPDLSASDSGLSSFGRGQAARALERARLSISGRRPTRTTPQVIRVIGVSDPYTSRRSRSRRLTSSKLSTRSDATTRVRLEFLG
jgi:hypothetical protein